MSTTIALLCLLLLLVALLLLRPSPAVSVPHAIPTAPPPLQTRIVTAEPAYALHPRWSLQKRKSSAHDSPQLGNTPSVDQFGRILSSSPVSDMHSPPRRPSTPLRLSFASKRRSSTASCTLDQADIRATSTSATQSPLQRTRFVNPFSKPSRSRTLSPPSTFKSPDTLSSTPSSPSARRRTLVNKFKSIFKSQPIPPEPSPIIRSKPILTTIGTRLRRKPVARTQPYGPPWNAPMPVPDFTPSQHYLQKPARTSPSPQTSRKHSVHQCSRLDITSMSPVQLSPRTFINELDEKLSLLQQQHIQGSILSPHR